MDHGNVLLVGANDNLIQRLQCLQNLGARIIDRIPRYDHITPHLISLHWLPVKSRIVYKVLLYAFKILHDLAPAYLTPLLTVYKPRRSLRSENTVSFQVPKVKSVTYGDNSFIHAAPVLWNSLPPAVRNMNSIQGFKRALKTALFKKAFYL